MRFFRLQAVCSVAVLLLLSAASTGDAQQRKASAPMGGWTGTWAASPSAAPAAGESTKPVLIADETLRLVVHTSIGGNAVRIRLSNTFGREAVTFAAAGIAQAGAGGSATHATAHALTFSGAASVTVPAGASVLSDAVAMPVAPFTDFAISLYLPAHTTVSTLHYSAMQTSYAAPGNQVAADDLNNARRITSWPYLTELEVASSRPRSALVALGSSTTDGAKSKPDANHRWTDFFALRLAKAFPGNAPGVLNQGIGGNRVLHDGSGNNGAAFGVSASARFDRDVLSMAGVKYVVIFEGGNDIGHPGDVAPASEMIAPDDLIAGYRQLIARAHEHGVRVVLGTITPFGGSGKPETAVVREEKRIAVNRWILSQKESDGVIDFARAVADPAQPDRFRADYDSNDHLHPNDAGYMAMAESVDLNLFR